MDGFVNELIARDIGDAHPRKMRAILDTDLHTLENELALSLDLVSIINVVHRLEGDALEVLLAYEEINALLLFGKTIGDTPLTLPSLAALLRGRVALQKDTKVYEFFEGDGWYEGKVEKVLPAAKYRIRYSDGRAINQTEMEVQQWVDVRADAEWKRLTAEAKKGFDYLQSRLDGTCNNVNYDCTEMWEVLQLLPVNQAVEPRELGD